MRFSTMPSFHTVQLKWRGGYDSLIPQFSHSSHPDPYQTAGKIWSVMCYICSSSKRTSSARGKSHGPWKQRWLGVLKPGIIVPGDLDAL